MVVWEMHTAKITSRLPTFRTQLSLTTKRATPQSVEIVNWEVLPYINRISEGTAHAIWDKDLVAEGCKSSQWF